MSQPQESEFADPASPTPNIPPRPSCTQRFFGLFGWMITVLISASLAIIAAAAILFYYFGFNLNTPGEIRQANRDLALLYSTNQVLQTEIAQLRTISAEQASYVGSAREEVDMLALQVTGYEEQAATVVGQVATNAALTTLFESNVQVAATIQAETEANYLTAALVATMQVDNARQLQELQQRTDRIARFLQRISDIAADLAAEDAALLPSVPSVPTPTATEFTPPTATPTLPPEATPTVVTLTPSVPVRSPTIQPTTPRPSATPQP